MSKKRINNKNFYRPKNIVIEKTGEISIRNYNRFIKNFMDPYDFGNNKRHFYYNNRKYKYGNTEKVNQTLTSDNKLLWNRYRVTEREIEFHLTAQDKSNLLYYTNSPLSNTPLFCFDIDNYDYTTKTDLLKTVEFLSSLFPNNYWEYSSSGLGIHFYILLDLSDFTINTEFYNSVLHSLSELLRGYINSFCNVKFDGIKADYCSYAFTDKNRPYISKCGTLCKLPRPVSLEDYYKLYNIGFSTIDTINKAGKYMASILTFWVKLYMENSCHYLSFVVPNYDYFLEWANKHDNKKSNNYTHFTFSASSSYYPSYSSSVTGMGATVPKNNKNNDNNGINHTIEPDANKRSLVYGSKYFRDYYRSNKIKPSPEEFRKSYRLNAGTGTEDDGDTKRLNECYELINGTFIPDKVKSQGINVGDFIDDIKKLITQEEITEYIVKKYPKKRDRVSIEDLDVGFCYYFKNLLQDKDDRAKKGRSFSIPYKGMIQWFQSLKNRKEYHKSCNTHKGVIIRDILLHIGILECIDKSYQPAKFIKHNEDEKNGISQKFVITEKCHRYDEFLKYYGKDVIDSVLIAKKQQIKLPA